MSILTILSLSYTLAVAGTEDQRIPMRLELELDEPSCVIHQNVPLKVRIVNPNDFPVTLRGFVMGYIEPEIHVLLDNGETLRLCGSSSDSAFRRVPVTIAAKGVLEKHRFLCRKSMNLALWPEQPGLFQLRGKTHLSKAQIMPGGEWFPIEWDFPIVELRIEPASRRDQRALDFLVKRIIEHDEATSQSGVAHPRVFRAELYTEFLERYPDSAYVPELRWHLVRLLKAEVDDQHGPLHNDPEMLQLLEECLTFCLDRGGAYSEEFLSWNLDRGGNHLMELAMKHRRGDLLKRIVKAVDCKYPDDEPAIMFRRVIVAGATESRAEGQRAAERLRQRFPESPYVERASQLLKYLDRQAEREKSEAP